MKYNWNWGILFDLEPGGSGVYLNYLLVGLGWTLATALAALLSASLLGGLVLVSSPPVRADAVSFTLYGRAIGGWGTSPGGETNPGPTFTVTEGDAVTARLIAEDGFDHGRRLERL